MDNLNRLEPKIVSPSIPWSRSEKIFSYSFFPCILVTATSAYLFFLEQNMQPLLAFYFTQTPVFLLVILFERIYPNKADWNQSHDDIKTDIGHNLAILVVPGLLTFPILYLIGFELIVTEASDVRDGLWPTSWPLLGQLLLALGVVEATSYWVHRLQHEVPMLWRFHAIHHSAHRLYWLNTGRFHFLDILMNFPGILVVLLLGAKVELYFLWFLYTAMIGVFQHSNLKVRIGILSWFFSLTELHRWHHSIVSSESNHNYGQNIIIWDVLS